MATHKLREKIIKTRNIKFIRFTNQEIEQDINSVLIKLKYMIKKMKKNNLPSPEAERGRGRGGQEKIYLHALGLIDQIGSKRIELLKNYFNDLSLAWQAQEIDLQKAGLTKKPLEQFLKYRKIIDPVKEFSKISPDIKLISQADKEYPLQLKEIHDPPQLLYCRGDVSLLKKKSLAIVGSRAMTEYGQRVCQELVGQIPLATVSGLATGIDTVVHQNSKQRTIAVLGSGINEDCIFPAENKKLSREISLVISEYAPYLKARREFFPMRNRIISGLSLGTLVIEAAERSGALITAYRALEQNRCVMAVPGPIYSSRSQGCNQLIQKGAKLVQNSQDIIEELELELNIQQEFINFDDLSAESKLILSKLSLEGTELDKIVRYTRLTPSCVLSNLTILELKGVIKNLGNNNFVLCQKN